jgi:hypothetical protein
MPDGEPRSRQAPEMRLGARHACARDGRIWAKSACIECRLPGAGWSATGIIAEMTKEQSLAFQERLGLPKSPVLTTTEAWSKTLASTAN